MFDEIDKLALMASLTEEVCGLSHGPDPDVNDGKKVVDYIAQGLGVHEGEGVSRIEDRLVVPICEDCANALYDGVWVLLYCLSCNRSQWIIKELAKREYKNNIVWMPECQNCGDKSC